MTAVLNRWAAALLAAALPVLCAPPAWGVDPPQVDASAVPPPGTTGSAIPLVQRLECETTGLIQGTDVATPAPAQRALDLQSAWQFSRGEGQTVAVIDTGVQPGPRLPDLSGGGDYIGAGDGLADCDGHGTAVAGLIAGRPGPDGFSGVAPAARLVSIRQTSDKFGPRIPGDDPTAARAAAEISSLARAVVRAADLGARVINISSVICLPAGSGPDQSLLGAALRYAAVDKDVVIVAAAGNSGPVGLTAGTACQSNQGDWAGVTTVSVPSWWQPYVLSVGSVAADGQPSTFTMSGPWLGLAAPGENVLSLSNSGDGLANGAPTDRGKLTPLSGTSFSAAYVSGVAALVRSRFPQLSAPQVVERLTATAHRGARSPSTLVGAGTVDPVAALTWQLPAPQVAAREQIAAPAPQPVENHTPRTIALAGTAVLAAAVAVVAFTANRRKDTTR
ncbi:type VII secretion-associated serine protease mycosin [Mycobacterium sp. DL592]|uniref:type VII secretion-associated serine protease mycosin n=1 Tax=Mycobacterium sp. DL592 TaxID=2675524 RepID=UPI00141DEFBF|nr:type VII secretion-associated serine protease mycosin [Mycobacterium sp. DL592]